MDEVFQGSDHVSPNLVSECSSIKIITQLFCVNNKKTISRLDIGFIVLKGDRPGEGPQCFYITDIINS